MGYLQVKNWTRAYFPAAILGVYTQDELETISPPEVDVTPTQSAQPAYLDDAKFQEIADKYMESVTSGRKTVDAFVAWVEGTGALLTEKQKSEVKSWAAQPAVVEGQATQVEDPFVAEMEAAETTQGA